MAGDMGRELLSALAYMEPFFCLFALLLLFRAHEHRKYGGLTALLSVHLLATVCFMALNQLAHHDVLPATTTYHIYFFVYWLGLPVEAVLSFVVILNIFRQAMAPLQGLRSLGMLVFRWAAGTCTFLSIALGFSPSRGASDLLIHTLSQFQQISSVITLGLLLFVCFAIKPLGLTLRSRVFGVSFGLGLITTAELAQAAWFAQNTSLASTALLFADLGGVLGLIIWSIYFAFPEPKRQIIVLPTTSPFLRWNQISEVLGDSPGFVAIAGVPPELFSPAEIEVMIRASIKMKQLDEFDPETHSTTLKTLSA